VPPNLIDGFLSRLETFVHPFSVSLGEPEQKRHTVEYLAGLLSKLDHKTGEGIAYLHDQQRQGITIDPQPVKVREGWLTISAQLEVTTWTLTRDAVLGFADRSMASASNS